MMIGIAGAGRMGTAFAKRLIEAGHGVSIWNRTPDRMVAAMAAGAAAVDVRGLAGCEVIIVSVADAEASGAVLDGLIAAGIGGRLVIEMSTLLPEAADALAARVETAGADFLHCPVGGTVAPALKGQLLGMAGGRAEAFARARPVLDLLCRRLEHLGTAGAAARMKLAVNLPLAVYWQVLGESLSLLRGSGIPAEMAISLMADSSAGPTVLKNRAQVVVDTLAGTDQPGTFDISGLAKDLRLAKALAGAEGADMPVAAAVMPRYGAAVEQGLGGFDGASLTRRVAEG